jgi:hypothetical protein
MKRSKLKEYNLNTMDKKLEETIKKSGNNLHMEIVRELEEEGWKVEISPYFYDDTTDKPREIDIIAKIEKPILDLKVYDARNMFAINLFIECKWFTKEIAFRSIRSIRDKIKQGILLEGSLDRELFFERSEFGKVHHNLVTPRISALYDTESENQKNVFDAITQPIKSYLFFKESVGSRRGISYLATIYNGIPGLYEIKDNRLDNLKDLISQTNASVGVNYSYKSPESVYYKSRYFIVDIINRYEISKYLNRIKLETKCILEELAWIDEKKA